MKKSFLAVLFAFAFAVPALAENMWIGGSIGYDSMNVEFKGGEKESMTTWSFEPEFGYSINDKWDIGLGLGYFSGQITELYGVEFTKIVQAPFDIVADAKALSIAPFARYHVAKIGDFDFMLKGSIFYVKHDLDVLIEPDLDPEVTGYGISIAPVVSYNINEAWSISATLNFAELSFVHVNVTDKYDYIPLENGDKFGFNLNKGSIINVGLSYNF